MDAWTGSARRNVVDFEVPGAVGSHGLKWERTYSSSSGNWSFSYTWRVYKRPSPQPFVTYPDGRSSRFEIGTKERLLGDGNGNNTNGVPGYLDLFLDEGSSVHLEIWSELSGDDQYVIDHITPLYLKDRYGRQTILDWQMYDSSVDHIRLNRITDPSGKYIQIIYNTPSSIFGYVVLPSDVQGSDGQWVHYTYENRTYGPNNVPCAPLTHVDYSDGTSADYTYAEGTYKNNGVKNFSMAMTTARDTRAGGPMQSVRYQYSDYDSGAKFAGQVKSEQYFNPANPTSSPAVSTLISNSSQGATSAIQTETRGDGPSRTIKMQKLAGTGQGPPFVIYKTDYNGVQEKYFYSANYFLNKITDRRAYDTNFTLESVIGNVTRKTHPDATYIDYTYTDSFYPYYIATVKDENGKTTTYTRNAITASLNPNVITRIDYPDGGFETFNYNSFGEVLTRRLPNNTPDGTARYKHYQYDTTGLLTAEWNPTYTDHPVDTEPRTTFSYYPSGHVWKDRIYQATDPMGYVTTYEYDHLADANFQISSTSGPACPGRGLVTKITYVNDTHPGDNPTYPSGTCKTFTYDQFGNKLIETDELGHTTTNHYDDYMRNDWSEDALGHRTNIYYDATNGSSSYTHTTKSIRRTIAPPTASPSPGITIANTYDNNLRLLTTIQAEQDPAISATTTFGYDANGNRTSVMDPRGYTTTTSYDTRNRKSQTIGPAPFNQTTTWAYDSASNVLTLTRPDFTTEVNTYDAMNRVLTHKEGDAAHITTFTYYPSGKMQTVKDARNNVTTFYYDPSDAKIQMVYPAVPPATQGDQQNFGYDNNHNLLWRQVAAPIATPSPTPTPSPVYQVFTYDARNRKKSMGWHNDTSSTSTEITWANGITDHSNFIYDGAGKLTQALNGFSTVNRHYDSANRMDYDEQILVGGVTKRVEYVYDNANENTQLFVNDGNGYDRTFKFDGMGRFLKVTNTSDSAVWFTYTYDRSSNRVDRLNNVNLIHQDYGTPDQVNRMQKRELKIGGTRISAAGALESYTYNAMNRLTNNLREDGYSDVFGYNAPGEMTSATYGAATPRNVNYTLDLVGNRTQVVDAGVTKTYAPANPVNEYTTVGTDTITNTMPHQIGAYQANNYQYVADSYVAAMSGPASYTLGYDALGRCVKRMLNGVTTYYVYDGEKPILEYKSDGSIAGKNVYGKNIDEILTRTDYVANPGGLTYYYQDDHEGSITHLILSNGTVIQSYRYDAFGAPTITTTPGYSPNNRFMFTGREYISQFGIYEYRARTYHPGLGRFMSEDPKGFDAGDYNLFRYCHNDPEDLTDPMGLESPVKPGYMPVVPSSPFGYEFDHDRLRQAMNSRIVEAAGVTTANERTTVGPPGGRKPYATEQQAARATGTVQYGLSQQNHAEYKTQIYGANDGSNHVILESVPKKGTLENVPVIQRDGSVKMQLKNVSRFPEKGKEPVLEGYHREAVVVSHTESLGPHGIAPHDRAMFKALDVHGYIYAPPNRPFGPTPTEYFSDRGR